MFRLLSRLLGFVLLAVSFSALIVDGTRSLAAGRVMMFTLDETVTWLFPGPLFTLMRAAEQNILAVGLLALLLKGPTWLEVGCAGLGLWLLGQRRRRTRGSSRQ